MTIRPAPSVRGFWRRGSHEEKAKTHQAHGHLGPDREGAQGDAEEEEGEEAMKCGCRIDSSKDSALKLKIIFCPLHKAAEEMLAYIKREHRSRGICMLDCSVRNLILRAEGRP